MKLKVCFYFSMKEKFEFTYIFWIIAKRSSFDAKTNILQSYQHHVVIDIFQKHMLCSDAIFIPSGIVSYADVFLLNYSLTLLRGLIQK